MLDDQKYIQQIDTQGALEVVKNQYKQLEHDFNVEKIDYDVRNIIFAGMGGSALAAQLSLTWPGYNVPFEIVREYDIPQYANKDTLVIASSYSGNTEEVVSVLGQAEEAGCTIVCLSSGGRLAEIADQKNLQYVELPSGLQPRYAVLYGFKALISILEACGFVKESEMHKQLNDVVEQLESVTVNWLPSVPTEQNLAKQLANKMIGKTPIIYGAKLYPAAYKWKINFNENAKNTAWCGQYSEFNHNEFLGWTSHPIEKPFAVVDLISSFDNSQIKKRFEISDKLLSGKRPKAIQINAEGSTILQQMLWVVTLGDMVSIYTAILNGVNPTPVDLIEKLKKDLA